MKHLLVAAAMTVLLAGPAWAQGKPAPEGARAYIIWPSDGAVIRGGKLWVRMGLSNMGVTPSDVAQ
ncbi:MAG TPA: hypothetical protein VK943_04270 [Arenibaculum sp.]|nr:hypothetical protein [Arenibaculum sp.]